MPLYQRVPFPTNQILQDADNILGSFNYLLLFYESQMQVDSGSLTLSRVIVFS